MQQPSSIVHDGKTIKSLHNGKVVVISPVDCGKVIVPFFCPVCEYPMKQAEDAASFREFSCCRLCDLYWKRSGLEIPEKTSERWVAYMERRHIAFLPQIILR